MAMLTIRNIDESLKTQLRVRAAQHGNSMEEEVRRILQHAVAPQKAQQGFATRVHQRVVALSGGFELALPPRSMPRAAPDFEDMT